MKYSKSFRNSILKKVLPPENRSVYSVAKEAGIAAVTINSWLANLKSGRMDLEQDEDNPVSDRSMKEKLNLLLEYQNIPEERTGEWLRQKGLHNQHVGLFRQETYQIRLFSTRNPVEPNFYIPNNHVAVVKYNVSATASTIVVISGPAIIAGSNLIFFAIMGNTPPTTFANTTIKNKVKQTVIETNKSVLSIKYILKKLTEDKINPTIQLTRSSFHKTLRKSLVLISPNAKPLIISVED